jgi:uncharacterized protein YjaG (DUF416 family)
VSVLDFDETQLVRDLESLLPRMRVAFAAACAERLRPAYLAFAERAGAGDPEAFEASLDRLWSDLDEHPMTDDELRDRIEECMALIPQEDDGAWSAEQAYAEDAAAALAYALRCRQSGQSQEAAWAARRAYEAIDYYVTALGTNDQVLSHPLVQAELGRQQQDIKKLKTPDADVRRIIAKLRERAEKDAICFFGMTT